MERFTQEGDRIWFMLGKDYSTTLKIHRREEGTRAEQGDQSGLSLGGRWAWLGSDSKCRW